MAVDAGVEAIDRSLGEPMTFFSQTAPMSLLRHCIEAGLRGLAQRLRSIGQGRRRKNRSAPASMLHHREHHFGMLDDQLLSDLGLLRSDIRAAEIGILPPDQALHHGSAKRRTNDTSGENHFES